MTDQRPKDYAIGYAKPPKHSRYRKGQSGNRRGRSKPSLSLSMTLIRALLETVTVNERGAARRMRKIDVAITQQINKAAAGDRHALKLLLSLLHQADRSVTEHQSITVVISKEESEY